MLACELGPFYLEKLIGLRRSYAKIVLENKSRWLGMKDILISVAMPCFNDAATLPRALASLVAQTHSNWECLLVDDGSSDDVRGVVEALGDARVVYVRFEKNRGLAAARQKTMEMARGEFFCLLDADDWYYPEKLERQLEVMLANPELALVSMRLAVVNEENQLVGVRGAHGTEELLVREMKLLQDIKFSLITTMMRTEFARICEFDERLKRTEDTDYIWRLMTGQSYGMMSYIGYAYEEIYSEAGMQEVLWSLGRQRWIVRKHAFKSPGKVLQQYVKMCAKSAIYKVAKLSGTGHYLYERRNEPASRDEVGSFEVAREVVLEVQKKAFAKNRR